MQIFIILYNTFIILTLIRKVLCLNLTNVIFFQVFLVPYTGTNGAPMNKLLNMFSSTKFWVPDRLPQICYRFLLLLANTTRRDMKINRCSFRKTDDFMPPHSPPVLVPFSTQRSFQCGHQKFCSMSHPFIQIFNITLDFTFQHSIGGLFCATSRCGLNSGGLNSEDSGHS